MGVSVRWNGHKDKAIASHLKDTELNKLEEQFFNSMKALKAKLDKMELSPEEENYFKSMRKLIDEWNNSTKEK